MYRTKLSQLKSDLGNESPPIERVFSDLTRFCLEEKRKTAFLIAQSEVMTHLQEHEFIQQLMDYTLIHVIEPDTSAASGRPGRFEAYTLDFALFMEARLRGIEHVEFWKIDEQHRRKGLREAPTYPLDQARRAAAATSEPNSEAVLDEIERTVGTEPDVVTGEDST